MQRPTIKAETGSGVGSSTATALSVVDTVYAPCGCWPLGKLWKTSMPHAPNATSVWCNLTQMNVYDFGNLSTPVRTYTNTYLTSANYTSRYIFNRLTQSIVTSGSLSTTLSQVYYDGLAGSCGGWSFNDPSSQQYPIGMHDSSYGTTFVYRGMPSSIVTPASTVCNTYDIGGNVTASSTNGVTTTSTTASGSAYAVPTTMTTRSLSNTMSYNSVLAPTSATGPNGDTAFIAYDGNARPSSTDSPSGAHTAFIYIDTQSPPMTIATISGLNTNTHWSRTTKDGFGRTIKAETGSGTGSSTATALSVGDTVYAPCGCSPLGKLWKTSLPHAPNATPVWTVHTYDGSGRTVSVTSPDGSSATTYVYQGNTVKVYQPGGTDQNGKWKKFTMDALGNLTSVLENDPTFGQVTTSYTYDMLNHLTVVSMPRGLTPQTTTTQNRYFNYTSGNTVGAHLLSTINPENGMVSYTYNTDHTLATKTDAKGQQFTYTYDGYKRPLTISVGGNLLRTYSYDTNPYDANYSQNSAGRPTAIQYAAINYDVNVGSPQGSTTFTDMLSYTQSGSVAGKRLRVTKVAPYPNGQNHTQTAVGDLNMAYAYNYEGKLISVTYPTDAYGTTPQFTYSYDAMMRPVGMTDQTNASIVSGVQYGPANELLQMTYIGGATETRQYNSMLQLTNITGLGQNITYTFPPAGQNAGKIASQTDTISGETVNYAYDSLNRLISAAAASNAWSQTYSYDGFGNLTNRMGYGSAQATTISTPANLATNQLSGYTYDLNGNLISTGYAYDAENRVVQANAGAVQYGYDGQNKRLWQGNFTNSGGGWLLTSDSISVFGIDGKMIGTYSPQPSWNNTQTQISIPFYPGTERVYFGSKLVAKLGGSGYLVGVVQDRLGSVGKYYPFGEERNSPPLSNDQVKFATYTRDSATGLDYADQRYYTNNLGRFTSPDRYQRFENIVAPQAWNLYAYVKNDPANRLDPAGLEDTGVGSCDPLDPDSYLQCDPFIGIPDAFPGSTIENPNFVLTDLIPMFLLSNEDQRRIVAGWSIWLRAAAAAAYAARQFNAQLNLVFPLDLVVTEDCYYRTVGALGVVYTREIHYTLYGSDGRPFPTSAGAIISEHLTPIVGVPGINSQSDPGGQFVDTISVGNSANYQVLQQFTVTLPPGSLFGIPGFTSIPVSIISRTGIPYGSNVITATPGYIDINYDPNLDSGGKQHPCPF